MLLFLEQPGAPPSSNSEAAAAKCSSAQLVPKHSDCSSEAAWCQPVSKEKAVQLCFGGQGNAVMPAPSHRKKTCLPCLGGVGWECNTKGTKNSSYLGVFQEDSLHMTVPGRNYDTERTTVFAEILFNGIISFAMSTAAWNEDIL